MTSTNDNPRQMEHLGNGICVDFDGENGLVRLFSPTDHGILEVYFDQDVLLAFLGYVARIGFWQPIATVNEPAPEHKDNGE
jgi:hypothetical protein